jgi:hypothetical protein
MHADLAAVLRRWATLNPTRREDPSLSSESLRLTIEAATRDAEDAARSIDARVFALLGLMVLLSKRGRRRR